MTESERPPLLFLGEELTQYPPGYKELLSQDKRKIQGGYLDLLFYEYRNEMHSHNFAMALYLFSVGLLLWFLPEHVRVITWLLLIGAGIGMLVEYRHGRRFHAYEKQLGTELERLGVGLVRKQLRNDLDSTDFGRPGAYGASGLGVVYPVTTGYGPDTLCTIDIFRDSAYR